MARLPLVIYPDVLLTRRSADILEIDGDVFAFGQAMAETMYGSHGIGLAAPQVDSRYDFPDTLHVSL